MNFQPKYVRLPQFIFTPGEFVKIRFHWRHKGLYGVVLKKYPFDYDVELEDGRNIEVGSHMLIRIPPLEQLARTAE